MKNCVEWLTMTVCPALLLVFAGCISADYVGQSFPALPEDQPVMIFSREVPAPDNTYRAIGRVTLTAPDGSSQSPIREKLSEIARTHGAEAVEIVEFKRVETGVGASEPATAGMPDWSKDNRNAGGAFIYSNSFGEKASLSTPRKFYEVQVKALLLVPNGKFNSMMELYRKRQAELEARFDQSKLEVKASSPEEALNKSVKTVESNPAIPVKTPVQEKKPTQIDLTDDRSNPAAL